MSKRILLLLFLCCVFCSSKKVYAGTYDNAYTFYNKWCEKSDVPAIYNSNDGYIYFGSKGVTSGTNVKYKTVGYSITLSVGAKKDKVEVKLGGTYIKDVSEIKKNGYTYVLRRVKYSRLLTLFGGNKNITWNEIYCKNNTYEFDAIMTVEEGGNSLCGKVSESSDYRTISGKNNAYLFRTVAGIKAARKWANPSDLDSFFDKTVVFPAKNYIDIRNQKITGNNVFFDSDIYYVKPNSTIYMSVESFFYDSDAAVMKFHPNYNIYSVTGWGDNQKYYTMQKRSGGNIPYSGLIADGTSDAKPITLIDTDINGTTVYTDCPFAFSSTIRCRFNVPDCNRIYIKNEGRVYYNYEYPDSLNNKNNLCDVSNNDGSICVQSDGKAPDADVPKNLSAISASYIPITAYDYDSGIKSVGIYRDDGKLISNKTFEKRVTEYNSDKDLYIVIESGYRYYVKITDNVGNIYNSSYIEFTSPKAHTVNALLSGGINGYNHKKLSAQVYGGNSEIAAFLILSEEDENPLGERVVFVNQSVMNGTMESGLYSYSYSLNPMNYLNNCPDGIYNIEIISGGKYVSSDPVELTYKKDVTSPEVTIHKTIDESKWHRSDLKFSYTANDNLSGIASASVMSNNQIYTGETTVNESGMTLSGVNTIDTEGVNNVVISVSDNAGNLSYKSFQYMLDKTIPEITFSGAFAGLDEENNVWLSKEKLKNPIYMYDSLSGMTTNISEYKAFMSKNGAIRELAYSKPYKIKRTDSKNVTLYLSDEWINDSESGSYDFIVRGADVAGMETSSHLYINVDAESPYADSDYQGGWDSKQLNGYVTIYDSHSGISSIEVYCNGQVSDSYYGVNQKSKKIYINHSELKYKNPVLYIKITDNAGNIYDHILAVDKDYILLEADIKRIDNVVQPIFMAGENGILRIRFYGSADYIKVFYPESLTEHNNKLNIEYDVKNRDSFIVSRGFNIPVKAKNGPYRVVVKAVKGDKEYNVYPEFEVYGCVTEKFRTRIR